MTAVATPLFEFWQWLFHRCPDCLGTGACCYKINPFCRFCEGRGYTTPQRRRWRRIGERIRQHRLAHRLGVRRFANANNILPSHLCDMEHGYMMPDESLLK
jgi:hypothetical protein